MIVLVVARKGNQLFEMIPVIDLSVVCVLHLCKVRHESSHIGTSDVD